MIKYHESFNIFMNVYYFILYKNYISLCYKILNCIQCGLVLNHEFDVEFNVRRNSYFVSVLRQAFTVIWFYGMPICTDHEIKCVRCFHHLCVKGGTLTQVTLSHQAKVRLTG